MKAINETTAIICGIVRDAEKGLKRNIPVIDALCDKLQDYWIFIYENDSRDGTKAVLTAWQQRDPQRIHVSLTNNDPTRTIPTAKAVSVNPFYSRKRISKMARLRNSYMEYIDQQGWEADYLIVVDLDVAQLSLGGILSSFTAEKEWDAVVANGYSTSPKLRRRYHDTYALTLWGDQDEPQTEAKIKALADELGTLKATDDWIRIASGFGGLAIYRFEAVRGVRYEALPNDDPRVEVRCEHYSLYRGMMARGYDHFYINPAMVLKYQRLTVCIAWRSLLRRLQIK